MPQMSPLLWFVLFIFFVFMFIMFLPLVFYTPYNKADLLSSTHIVNKNSWKL